MARFELRRLAGDYRVAVFDDSTDPDDEDLCRALLKRQVADRRLGQVADYRLIAWGGRRGHDRHDYRAR